MRRTGKVYLPLHTGRCPPWLFEKMKVLGKRICEITVSEYGKKELVRRFSDPFWFQSLACALGFDFHSSGSTTVTLGALKEAGLEETGIFVLGGKGKRGLETISELEALADRLPDRVIEKLKIASISSSKVDSACVQDGYDLYHHSLIFAETGEWCVIQQGMNGETGFARRYHWIYENLKSFTEEPHSAVCCDARGRTLNLVHRRSREVKKCILDMLSSRAETEKSLRFARNHGIRLSNYSRLLGICENPPDSFDEFVRIRGIGPKTLRALCLVAKLIYGTEPSWEDPVKFSFAHGGKDGVPYPVDRRTYGKTVQILEDALRDVKMREELKRAASLFDF